jgi:molecular chaperone GrpE
MIDDENQAAETPEAANDGADGAQSTDPVAQLMAENAALKEQALRYAAEVENTKRRAEKEANDARAYAIQRFARDLFEVADNLSRALQAAPRDHAEQNVKNLVLGIDMTEKALKQAFERNGLKVVQPARGDKFDPHLHQAMMEQADPDLPPGVVLNVLQTGYELFGRIVRPAMVAVTPRAASGAGAGATGGYAQAPDPATVDTKA